MICLPESVIESIICLYYAYLFIIFLAGIQAEEGIREFNMQFDEGIFN